MTASIISQPEAFRTWEATNHQLDVGILQDLLDPVGQGGLLADQLGPLQGDAVSPG